MKKEKSYTLYPSGYKWVRSIPNQHFDTLKLYVSMVMDDCTIEDISTKLQLAIAFSKDQGQSYGEYHRKCFENIMRLGYTTEQEISDNLELIKETPKSSQAQLDSLKPKGFSITLPNTTTTITDHELYLMIKGHMEEFNPAEYTKVGQLIQNLLIGGLVEITAQLENSGIIKDNYHQETLKNNLNLLSQNIIHKVITNEIYNLRVPTLTVEILKQLYNHDLETLKY